MDAPPATILERLRRSLGGDYQDSQVHGIRHLRKEGVERLSKKRARFPAHKMDRAGVTGLQQIARHPKSELIGGGGSADHNHAARLKERKQGVGHIAIKP